MNTRHAFPGTPAAVLLLVAGISASCVRTTDGCSSPGTEGCACVAGQCDTGLTCVADTCRPAGGGPAASAGGGSSGAISPLPENSFVFHKRIRRGGSMSGARFYPTFVSHLYAYDLATRTERLITTFDDDGTKPGGPLRSALSPDRKWVAFVSAAFRRMPGDNPPLIDADLLWAVSVDGKQFKRLSPPLPEDYDKGPGCNGNGDCPLHSHCMYVEGGAGIQRRCVKVGMSVSYDHPIWSRDGQTIYFEEYFSVKLCNPNIVMLNNASAFHLCRYSVVQAVTGGAFKELPRTEHYCYDMPPLAIHPQKDNLLVSYETCRGGDALREWTVPPGSTPQDLREVTLPVPPLQEREDAAWLADGSGLLLLAGQTKKTTVNPEGFERKLRMGIHLWSESAGFRRLYESDTDDGDIGSLAVLKTGDVIVEVIRTSGTQETSQLHLFDPKTGKILEPLTRDDSNTAPGN